jgi:hypothetical protein
MENIIYVVLDTDNEKEPIKLGKPQGYVIPEDKDKFTEDVMLDLKTLVEGVFLIGSKLDEMGTQAYDDTIDEVINQLREAREHNQENGESENEVE